MADITPVKKCLWNYFKHDIDLQSMQTFGVFDKIHIQCLTGKCY